jgi:acyl-CoA synthetase (AMP-forming)/AMP-acid ligase II/1-acyl-sn-glycerol-3-phosphate acyltransferase/acyl carrier protein
MLMDILRLLFCHFARFIVSLRYRVRYEGLEKLSDPALRRRTLIVPNHPSLTEPIISVAYLWPYLHMRPMLYAVNFSHPLLHWIMGFFRAVQVPVTSQQSAAAREGAEKAVREVIEGLRSGDNFIMWPAGRIYRQPHEDLGSASGLAEVLRAVPDAQVIMVRTRGMWGSMFSWAYYGTNPDLISSFKKGMSSLIGNLFFFCPRREISITVERVERSSLPEPTKELLNPYFEAWYNAEENEEARYVPYHFLFGPRRFAYPPLFDECAVEFDKIRPETVRAVREIVQEHLKHPLDDAQCIPSMELENLGLDSLQRMELTAIIEGRFGFSGDRVPMTFGELCALAAGMLQSRGQEPKTAPPLWFRKSASAGVLEVNGATVTEAFLNYALSHRDEVAAADDTGGAVTYEKLIVSIRIMARRFQEMENRALGILLPSSVACDVSFLAAHFAGRLPVMLNWTTGPGNLAHAARLMGITHVITSRRFIDRLGLTMEGVDFVYLEDLRRGISKSEMVATFLKTRLLKGALAREVHHSRSEDTAVVLFTSGSEKAPKAVPLTHGNLIANIRGGLKYLKPAHGDSLLAILPPFHSFGLTATMLIPLLAGLRVVHHPDPTDAGALVAKIKAYRPTHLFLTPTFLAYILDRASGDDLQSLATIVTGAEKTPDLLFEKLALKAPGASLYEGYGITECSPIVSMNAPGHVKRGTIGRAIPGSEIIAVDSDTLAPLAPNTMGMLLVRGPSVFAGYLAHEGASPFLERDGKRWYVTGDLGRIDEEGYITFSGRLKRFLKAGGEMISLPAIEEPLSRRYPPTDKGPRIAVEGIEHEGGRTIILFTIEDISPAEAHAILSDDGLRGIMRIDRVVKIETIPLLGTGKTDYKVLRKMIEDMG